MFFSNSTILGVVSKLWLYSFVWSKPIAIFRAGAQILQMIYRRQSEIIGTILRNVIF